MNTTEWKSYPYSPWDLSDPIKVYATCPECDWRCEAKTTKTPVAFFKHYDETHR